MCSFSLSVPFIRRALHFFSKSFPFLFQFNVIHTSLSHESTVDESHSVGWNLLYSNLMLSILLFHTSLQPQCWLKPSLFQFNVIHTSLSHESTADESHSVGWKLLYSNLMLSILPFHTSLQPQCWLKPSLFQFNVIHTSLSHESTADESHSVGWNLLYPFFL